MCLHVMTHSQIVSRSVGEHDCSANAVAANCLALVLAQPIQNAEGSQAASALFSERLMILCGYTHSRFFAHSVPPLKCNN